MASSDFIGNSEWRAGDSVPFHLTWYIVLSSYFVSLAGALTTVELLHRRKGGSGWLSWLQLGACSVSFGLVAIWCMHFVGNRAIVLGNGEAELQLYYSPSYTALSAFLPIIFLFGAFMIADLKQKKSQLLFLYLCLSGFVAGLSITGMHYVGNFGIVNYKLENPIAHIIGAAAIAIISCIIALTLFFLQKEMWINSLWRRIVCAIVLASAVSGMHWVASIGTRYTLTQGRKGSVTERNTNLIVAVVMAALACLVCAVIAWDSQRRRKEMADRAQQVVLASVMLDPDGKFLVTNDGLLPSQKVTRQYNQRSFEDEFNQSHPVFQWLYRVTHNWSGIVDLIPTMRQHLLLTGSIKEYRPGSSLSLSSSGDDENDEEYSVIFRELFCVAAAELAGQLNQPLDNLGILHDSIMQTGRRLDRARPAKRTSYRKNLEDVESGPKKLRNYGKGQLLLLVRRIDRAESNKLCAGGFRFATLNQVGSMMARSMQVSLGELVSTMERVRSQTQIEEPYLQGRVYLSCFAIRALLRTVRASTPKWEILVPKNAPAQLPSVELCNGSLGAVEMDLITQLDGFSIDRCLQQLIKPAPSATHAEQTFRVQLRITILELVEKVSEPFFRQAIFCAKPLQQDLSESNNGETTTILPFCIIPDVHTIAVQSPDLMYTPLSFFNVRQKVVRNAPNHVELARRIQQEFGALAARKDVAAAAAARKPGFPIRKGSIFAGAGSWPFASKPPSYQGSGTVEIVKGDLASDLELAMMRSRSNSSEKPSGLLPGAPPGEADTMPLQPPAPTAAPVAAAAAKPHQPWGGIMVHSDVTVDADAKAMAVTGERELGNKAEVGVTSEPPTFVDELFRTTCARFQKP